MFKKKLEFIFLSVVFMAIALLSKNYYNAYIFKNNDISDEYKKLIQNKEMQILKLMQNSYGFSFKVPLIITDKFKGKLFGLTSYKDGEVKIYLNKKVMQESMDYILNNVIAHEYAHAFMFKKQYLQINNDGHSKEWKQVCINLGGLNCKKYVNQNDVVMAKMPF